MKPVSDEQEPALTPQDNAESKKLKSRLQIGLFLVVLVGGIGLATYVTQYVNTRKEVLKPDGGNPDVEPIRYSFLEMPARQVEVQSENYQDYYFANVTSETATMRLMSRGCTCVHTVESATWSLREALGELLPLGSAQPLEALAALRLVEERSWEELPDVRSKVGEVHVPPAEGPLPRLGLLRASWKARPPNLTLQQTERVSLDVVSHIGDGTRFARRLWVVFDVTRPFGFFPHSLEVGELQPGNKRSFDCVIWSTTRDWVDFDLKLSPLEGKQANECFVLGPVQQVSAGELATLAKTVGSIHASTLPRCAYHFTFTVYENRNSQQLDLGPFYRVLVISSGPEIEPIRVAITGLVRGEVQLVGGEKDQIPLGSFRSDRGTTKVVTLVAPKNVTLEYARVTTDAIKSKLELAEERDGRRFWKLIVEAPPESFTGDLQSAAIVLKVKKGDSKEAPERSLRIPVTGNAYR